MVQKLRYVLTYAKLSARQKKKKQQKKNVSEWMRLAQRENKMNSYLSK